MLAEEHASTPINAPPVADVSIVFAAYTEERWEDLVGAIASVRSQSTASREIIVVIDNNPSLLARVVASIEGVIAVENTSVRGAGEARNLGVSLAKGEIIAFLDDDAAADPMWIERAAAAFSDPNVLGVGGTILPRWEGDPPRWMAEEFYWTIGCTYPGLPEEPAPVRNLIAANMFVRRDVFLEVGGFRSGFGKTGARSGTEETELCIRAARRHPEGIWLYDPSVIVTHRVPKGRARWRYFVSRCYDEGVAKASIVEFFGRGSGLEAERTYTMRTLPLGVARGLRSSIRGDAAGLGRSASILVGLLATVVGYLRARAGPNPSPALAPEAPDPTPASIPPSPVEHRETPPDERVGPPAVDPPPRSERGPGTPPWHRAIFDLLLLTIAAAALVACVADLGAARPLLLLGAACLLPGGALLALLPVDENLERLAIAIGLSLAIETAAATVMVWTGWWHPFGLAAVLGILGSGILLLDLGRIALAGRRSAKASSSSGVAPIAEPIATSRLLRLARPIALLLPAVAALVIWGLSLEHVPTTNLDSYGLPPVLPIGWYAALAAAVVGAVAAIASGRGNALVIAVYVGTIAIILYATIPLISEQPQYTWVYKHIGVVRYLEVHGQVDPNIDIYHRWPGFFALGAVFSTVADRANPAAYVKWAELFFTFVNLILVTAVVRSVVSDVRVAGGAALFFLLTNWVGQAYFAPQALTYVLSLTFLLIALRRLRSSGAAFSRPLARAMERLGRIRQIPLPKQEAQTWPRWAALALVLFLDAVIVVSHQLTPYMLLGGTLLLMLGGVVRPWWLLVAMASMTFAYFLVNYDYIDSHFRLFTSLDPFRNAQVTPYQQTPLPGKLLNTRAELLAILVLWLGGIWGAVRLLRRGLLLRALAFPLLALAPLVIVFGQNYGGEASLRIVLFSSPWLTALLAWGLVTVDRRPLRQLATLCAAAACSALFVVSFFGQAELNLVSDREVEASEWFYSRAEPGSVLMLAAPGFPLKYGSTYPEFRGPEGDAFPNLMSSHLFQNRRLGPKQIPDLVGQIQQYSPRGYISFSRNEAAFAEVMRLTPPGALADLEQAVARSPRFRLSYGNPDVRIYQLVG